MQQVPLNPVPNQTIAFNADGAFWEIHIFQSIKFMVCDIFRDSAPIIRGSRCFGGTPLLPYAYMYAPNFGNFIFDGDVDFEQFGLNCNLFYLSKAEIDAFEVLRVA